MMMHEFVKYPDETLVVFSDIRKKENGEEYLIVCFERPTNNGFDTVIFELPSYNIIKQDGNYSEEEIKRKFFCVRFIIRNLPTVFKNSKRTAAGANNAYPSTRSESGAA